jgi:hypothetical protein
MRTNEKNDENCADTVPNMGNIMCLGRGERVSLLQVIDVK